jgi:hypothetical protein
MTVQPAGTTATISSGMSTSFELLIRRLAAIEPIQCVSDAGYAGLTGHPTDLDVDHCQR